MFFNYFSFQIAFLHYKLCTLMLRRRSLGPYVYTVYGKVSYSGGIICHKIYQVNSDSSNAIVEWMSIVCYVWIKYAIFLFAWPYKLSGKQKQCVNSCKWADQYNPIKDNSARCVLLSLIGLYGYKNNVNQNTLFLFSFSFSYMVHLFPC